MATALSPSTSAATSAPLGGWTPSAAPPRSGNDALVQALRRVRAPFYVVESEGGPAVATRGTAVFGEEAAAHGSYPILAYVPGCPPESLGDPRFAAAHRVRYPYVAGAMANGIGSVELVESLSRAGMLAFFGAAGLSLPAVEAALDRLQPDLGELPYGVNLIHSPNDPDLEAALVDLFLRRGVRLVEASAYLDLTLSIVRYRTAGIHRDASGRIVTPNRVVAKASRVEVARKFLSPPPDGFLRELVAAGRLTQAQAELAARVPMADDLTAEADSAGHTDNRPLVTMLPSFLALRDRIHAEQRYDETPRIGAAGGISTPASAAAAFALGAAYVLTGSVNQACVESGSSDIVRDMLARAGQADIAMAPAADMFEMGVKVQVLKRGTMFAMRAARLYDAYRAYDGLAAIPEAERALLERDLFRAPVEEVWARTREFFLRRDPPQVTRAEADPRHKMALVFRWYLGLSSRWANAGDATRQLDYQVWCGPAMGAFNEWVKGSFLEGRSERQVLTVALNLLVGAAALTRSRIARLQGVPSSPEMESFPPLPPAELQALLAEADVA
ncbi:MAG: PfaD family polyunsaturated fatty acid/polyketide biosynthesis protein [Planctomycetes bacterium]|nr:PfaD family polyunsaturated fatty acid/polyketide biosynthesis protein [Planctomycetota bacterium]